MGKKKNKKKGNKKGEKMEKIFNINLNNQWEDILDNIESMNKEIEKADKKNKIKKSDKIEFYVPSKESIKVRENCIKMFKNTKFIDSVIYALTHAGSYIKLIARAFCVLIVALLSFEGVRKHIPELLMSKLSQAYTFAMSI